MPNGRKTIGIGFGWYTIPKQVKTATVRWSLHQRFELRSSKDRTVFRVHLKHTHTHLVHTKTKLKIYNRYAENWMAVIKFFIIKIIKLQCKKRCETRQLQCQMCPLWFSHLRYTDRVCVWTSKPECAAATSISNGRSLIEFVFSVAAMR